MTPDQMNYALTACGFIITAGAVHLWRKGDAVGEQYKKDLIEIASGCAKASWNCCAAMATCLAVGDIVGLIAEGKKGAEIARDPVLRLQHTGNMTMANINALLSDPKFGPQIRAKVKQQDILIKSEETNVSEPV